MLVATGAEGRRRDAIFCNWPARRSWSLASPIAKAWPGTSAQVLDGSRRRRGVFGAQRSAAESVQKLVGDAPVFVCDVEHEEQIARLREAIGEIRPKLHGLVHSIAFADYVDVAESSADLKPFHETPKAAFLRAVDISCYSLIALSNALRELFDPDASVVTISISTTRMASENYGFMAPIKAALDSSLAFLAKSFSRFSRVRFNAVAPGLLKTSASAGIPGYVDSYLYAEQVTLRKRAVQTEEVANAAAFLLSPRSSGINAQQIVVDAGMSVNYFDRDLVRRACANNTNLDHGIKSATRIVPKSSRPITSEILSSSGKCAAPDSPAWHRTAGVGEHLQLAVHQIQHPVSDDAGPCINSPFQTSIDHERSIGGFDHQRNLVGPWRASCVVVQRVAGNRHIWLRLAIAVPAAA